MHKEMIQQLIGGMHRIEDALTDCANEELYNIVLGVCNGEFGEGYAMKKSFFKYSFDEEVWEIIEWAEEEMEIDISPMFYRSLKLPEWDNIHKILRGFQEMNIALGRLSALSRRNPTLRNMLTKVKTEAGYNPFQLYGIVKFETSLKGWKQAYIKELKDQIGRRKIVKKREEVSIKYFIHTELGQRLRFDPTKLGEEDHRIQLENEESKYDVQWYDKSQLQSLSEKEYEAWYHDTVLPSMLIK